MSSDFSTTISKFAEATIGRLLPLEALDAATNQKRAKALARARRKAERKSPSARVTGRLVFASTAGTDSPKPLAHMTVQLWDRDLLGTDDWLGEADTDIHGRFHIDFDPADAGRHDTPDLELRVVDRYAGRDEVLLVVDGPDNHKADAHDFGDVGVPFYEYHPDLPLAHVHTFKLDKRTVDGLPQRYAPGRKLALARVANRVLGQRLKHYTIDRETRLEDIQADYRGLTRYQTPTRPGLNATDDQRFVYKTLNGACPSLFTRTDDGLLHIVRTWDRFELDGQHRLPNVHAVFRPDGDHLVPVSITLQERTNNAPEPHAPLDPARTFRPGERGWADAIHRFECANYVYTQVANHLGRGHFNAEQMALAAFRNLRKSPLSTLLFPHLKEVMIINVEGESAIFGPDGLITQNSALTEHSLAGAIALHSSIDWRGWRPRQPLTADHDYARIANLVWDAICEHVDSFLSAHLDGILATWSEVVGLSDDLVAHSVAYEPWPLLPGHVHHDLSEEADPSAPRRTVGGVVRCMSPIVAGDTPSPEDLRQLGQFCAYAIFHAGFFHGWINDTTDSLEASYAQYNPAADSTPRELTNHISLNLALSQTRYGLVLADEDGDIPASFKAAVEARAEQLAALGYDVRQLRSRTNI